MNACRINIDSVDFIVALAFPFHLLLLPRRRNLRTFGTVRRCRPENRHVDSAAPVGNWWHNRAVTRCSDEVALPGRVLYLVDDPDAMRAQLAGRNLPPDHGLPLRHDISTDEITPAGICYHYDDTLAEFPYLGLVCGGERPVRPGAVKAGGFAVSVSGRRRGKGSSREASPYAELSAGIRLAVAESLEHIYETNCINLGLFTTTDFSVLERLHAGCPVPLAAFTEGKDPISAEVVSLGGLFHYNVARLQGHVQPPDLTTPPRPMTLAERILAAHARQHGRTGMGAVAPGDAAFVTADLRFSHEYVTPMASAMWDNTVGPGVPLTDHDSVLFFRDHLTLLKRVMPEAQVAAGRLALAEALASRQREFASRMGVRLHDETPDGGSEGICHTLVLERYALPGQIVLGTDSHACQAGAVGALAIGCGTTDMFNAWFTRDVRVAVPGTVRVEIVGTPGPAITAKDIMLLLLAHPFVCSGRALGLVIEYAGDAVRAMEVEERATLTNMAAEVGGFTGIVAPDEKVVDFLVSRRRASRAEVEGLIESVHADAGCEYADVIRLDVSELEPMIATPGDPGNGRPARELEARPIHIAYGGSCTAGKRSDMDMMAAVLRWGLQNGLRVPAGVRFFIQCGSQDVQRYCEEAGHIATFRRAGAEIVPPSCGACINAGPGVSCSAEEVTITSINRNFPGRSGPGQVYLASPSTVAASALAGCISTWPRLRRRHER
jgi:3-isopropylmalate/(R)-2-methylmalate dehydratase large subunit